MINFNPNNARIKRDYYIWQKNANHKSDATIDNNRKSIDRFESFINYKDFKYFNKKQAINFKIYFSKQKSKKTKEAISKSTLLSTIRDLKKFFKWLTLQKGYKKIDINSIEYFNLTDKEIRMAQAQRLKKVPTIEQIKKVLSSMPFDTEIEKRNKALIAFTLLTGMRDGAIASLKLKHVSLENNLVEQLGSEVKTKFSKTIYTYFFPVGNEIKQIFIDWINFLYKEKLFNGNDPVFPRTKLIHDTDFSFKTDGLEPIHWNSANQIRKIFKDAFENARFEYFSPHTFRNALTRLGEKKCNTPEEFKTWSENLGHNDVMTTFSSYGSIEPHRRAEIMKKLAETNNLKKDEILKSIKAIKNVEDFIRKEM